MRAKLSAFALGAALAGLAGSLYATTLGSTAGPDAFDFNRSIIMLCCIILGGLGSPLGAFVGALVIGVVSELSTLAVPPNYRIGVPLCAIAVILVFRPQGLFGQPYIRK